MQYVVGTGRCGTKTVAKLCGGLHEPQPNLISEATHYYLGQFACLESLKWKLRIRALMPTTLISDHKQSTVIPVIHDLDPSAEMIVLAREPYQCIGSFFQRGWLDRPSVWNENRIQPSSGYPADWTRAMKCGWLWAETYRVIFRDLLGRSFRLFLTHELGNQAWNASRWHRPLNLTQSEADFLDRLVSPTWEDILSRRSEQAESWEDFLDGRSEPMNAPLSKTGRPKRDLSLRMKSDAHDGVDNLSHSSLLRASHHRRVNPLPKQPRTRIEYPKAEPRAIKKLAAVTCHYNPCGYARLEDNYYRFAENLPEDLDLYTVELAYDDSHYRLHGARMIRVRGSSERHILWQKERLLNLAIERLPDDVDAVAWLDADLLWLNPDWASDTQSLLEQCAVVQLFEYVWDTDREGHLVKSYPSYVHTRLTGEADYGRPGGAWAARREAVADGLYDRHAIGGADSAMVYAWEARSELPTTLSYGTAWEQDYRAWAEQSHSQVGGSLACVPGDVVHLYHGSRQNRRYVERYRIFHDHAYDPRGDVEIDPITGLLQWSAQAREIKPDMIRRVAEYFAERREDD